MFAERAPTTGKRTPADAAPQVTALRLTIHSENASSYCMRHFWGVPATIPTEPIQDSLAGGMASMEIGLRKLLNMFGLYADDDDLEQNKAAKTVPMGANPKIIQNTTVETPERNQENVRTPG